jgi:hypothetical protein
MKGILVLTIAGLLVLAWGCKSKKTSADTEVSVPVEEEVAILSIRAKSCRGTCRRYSLEATPSGTATLVGIKNVSNIGTFKGQWDMAEIEALFQEYRFTDLEDTYLSGAKDIQKFEIMYNAKKVIFHKRKAPENLLQLFTTLEDRLDSGEWEKEED